MIPGLKITRYNSGCIEEDIFRAEYGSGLDMAR
jgi:hypothetical protein